MELDILTSAYLGTLTLTHMGWSHQCEVYHCGRVDTCNTSIPHLVDLAHLLAWKSQYLVEFILQFSVLRAGNSVVVLAPCIFHNKLVASRLAVQIAIAQTSIGQNYAYNSLISSSWLIGSFQTFVFCAEYSNYYTLGMIFSHELSSHGTTFKLLDISHFRVTRLQSNNISKIRYGVKLVEDIDERKKKKNYINF